MKRFSIALLTLVFIAWLPTRVAHAQANLVTNGDFSNGFTGWAVQAAPNWTALNNRAQLAPTGGTGTGAAVFRNLTQSAANPRFALIGGALYQATIQFGVENFANGDAFRLRFFIPAAGAGNPARVFINNPLITIGTTLVSSIAGVTGSTATFQSGQVYTYTSTFNAISISTTANRFVQVRGAHNTAGGIVFVDNIGLSRVPELNAGGACSVLLLLGLIAMSLLDRRYFGLGSL